MILLCTTKYDGKHLQARKDTKLSKLLFIRFRLVSKTIYNKPKTIKKTKKNEKK